MAEGVSIPSPSTFFAANPSASAAPAPSLSASGSNPARPPNVRKTSRDGKKATPKKDQPVDACVVKPKQSKSRNGCITCKAKRLKCDEEKPGCQQCARRNVECGGYKKDFKWRPFEDSNVKVNIDKQKRATSPKWSTFPLSTTPPRRTTPPPERPPRSTACLQPSTKDHKSGKGLERGNGDESLTARRKPSKQPAQKGRVSGRDSANASPSQPLPDLGPPPDCRGSDRQTSPDSRLTSHDDLALHRTPSSVLPGFSPTIDDILQLGAAENVDNNDFVNFALPEDMEIPLITPDEADSDLVDGALFNDDIEDIMRHDEVLDGPRVNWASRFNTPSSSNSSRSDEALGLLQRPPPLGYLFHQPNFGPDSIEALTMRFDKMTCGILSVIDGPTENPWRSLLWPLAQQSPALYHAMAAMTAFHSSTDVAAFRIVGHEHKSASIRYIQEGIRDNSISDETAIATALALGFSESWDQHTSTGNSHIKGAQVLVKRALRRHQTQPLQGLELARLKFLCNAWVYMDVIARLTALDSDDSNDFDNTFFFSTDPPNTVSGGAESPGFGIDFGMPIDARLDPLMGCANTLFPLIGRVANLVRKVCRSSTTSPAVISAANDLKSALEAWEPPAFIERPEDPSTRVPHALQTAEAYRWATLLHLHQAVPEIPSPSSQQLAQRVLQFLATVPLESRTVIVQIFPLMVAGCEAATAEDRGWVRGRWAGMAARMKIGVIEKSALVTEEVWRRKDAWESRPRNGRGDLVATAALQPVRRRGGMLPPTAPADPRENLRGPGATGRGFGFLDADAKGRVRSSSEKQPPARSSREPSDEPDRCIGPMDVVYTVRGHLHWVGVMWDWGWEGE